MTEEQKSLGQVCYEAYLHHIPQLCWEDVGEAADLWERAGQAVIDAHQKRVAQAVFDSARPERKGKRLRELEARVEELEYWRNQGALR